MRWGVAAIHETVDEDALDVMLPRHAQQREQVLHVRVHAAVAQQAEKMQIARPAAFHRLDQ